jgi:hypothetical protein
MIRNFIIIVLAVAIWILCAKIVIDDSRHTYQTITNLQEQVDNMTAEFGPAINWNDYRAEVAAKNIDAILCYLRDDCEEV